MSIKIILCSVFGWLCAAPAPAPVPEFMGDIAPFDYLGGLITLTRSHIGKPVAVVTIRRTGRQILVPSSSDYRDAFNKIIAICDDEECAIEYCNQAVDPGDGCRPTDNEAD